MFGRVPLASTRLPDRVGVVTLVTVKHASDGRQVLEKLFGGFAISHLAARQQERDRAALAIGQGMDLGRAAPARAPDRLALLPPLPPDAERCALTAEESIST